MTDSRRRRLSRVSNTVMARLLLDEIVRVRAQEEARLEIEKAEQKENRSQVVWRFLNSSFGLWLLSAVVLSGFGGLWTLYQEHSREAAVRLEARIKAEQENREAVEKLDFEVSYRLSQVLLRLKAVSMLTAQDYALLDSLPAEIQTIRRAEIGLKAGRQTVAALLWLHHAPEDRFPPLYTEYAGENVPALLTDIRRRLKDDDEIRDLDRVLAVIGGFTEGVPLKTEDPAREAASYLLQNIVLRRWKKSSFFYVDCRPSEPFC